MNTPNILPIQSMVPAKWAMVFSPLFVGAALAWFTPAAFAGERDMGCSPTLASPCSGGSTGGSSSGGGGLFGIFRSSPSAADRARQQRVAESHEANHKGVEFSKKEDWANAIYWYQVAVAKNPDDEIIWQNLAQAQTRLANEKGEASYHKGDWANAVAFFQEAVRKNPFEKNLAIYRSNLATAQAELQRQAEIQQQAEVQRRAELQRRREEEERRADESRTRLLAEIRRTDPAPPLQFRLGSASRSAAVPLTPFSQGVAPANAGPEFRVGGSVSDGGRSALDQLGLAAGHGSLATAATAAESASREASCVFDTPCERLPPPRVASPQTPTSIEIPQPVTSRMAEIRQQLDENRVKREKLEKEIEDLRKDPQPTPQRPVEISAKKDELNRAEQEKNYLDLSWKDELDKAAAAAAPVPGQPATAASAGQE